MKRITERRYTDMLEVLPPAATKFVDGGLAAFLVGEPATHKNGLEAYTCYVKNVDHYSLDEPQTLEEFHAIDISTLPYNEAEDAEEDAEELAARDEHGDAIVDAALACGVSLDNIDEAYAGEYDSDEDFARDMAEQCGDVIQDTWPHRCIDWEYAARELMYDYCEDSGHYFRNL